MASWPLVVVLVLLSSLLAGCSSSAPPPEETPAPTTAEDDGGRTSTPGQPEEQEDLGPLDQTFHGTIAGVGTVMPDGSHTFAGVSSWPEEFRLRAGATLDVTLTWNLTAPAWVHLILVTPDEVLVLDADFPNDPLGRTIHYNETDAAMGVWNVVARSQGPAIVDYTIHVVATYPDAANTTAPMAP